MNPKTKAVSRWARFAAWCDFGSAVGGACLTLAAVATVVWTSRTVTAVADFAAMFCMALGGIAGARMLLGYALKALDRLDPRATPFTEDEL